MKQVYLWYTGECVLEFLEILANLDHGSPGERYAALYE